MTALLRLLFILCLFLNMLPLKSDAFVCRRLFENQAEQAPIGFSQDQFSTLINHVRSNRIFNDLDVMVLFGSRTHFRGGPQPTSLSDLDVMTFPKSPLDFEQRLLHQETVNQSLQSLSVNIGIKINEDIPASSEVLKLLRNGDSFFRVTRSAHEENLTISELDSQFSKGLLTREQYQDEYNRRLPGFSKDVIFLVPMRNLALINTLLQLGYLNVVPF